MKKISLLLFVLCIGMFFPLRANATEGLTKEQENFINEFNKNNPVVKDEEIKRDKFEFPKEFERNARKYKNDLPETFNFDGKLGTPIKHQGQLGICWAYASTGLVEHAAATKLGKKYKFSERYVDYISANNATGTDGENPYTIHGSRNIGDWGNWSSTMPLYTQGRLPVLTQNFDKGYSTDPIKIEELGKNSDLDVASYVKFYASSKSTNEEKEKVVQFIKKLIKENGAVTYEYNTNLQESINEVTGGIYNSYEGFPGTNHSTILVGWDDHYNKDNFKKEKRPNNNGAFVMKNSWGTRFGKEGYYYVSYEDMFLFGRSIGAISEVYDEKNYDNSYISQVGETKWWFERLEKPTESVLLSNDFSVDASKDETIFAVSIRSEQANAPYEIYINPKNNEKATLKDYEKVASGVMESSGTKRVTLKKPIKITSDESISVVVKYKYNPSYNSIDYYYSSMDYKKYPFLKKDILGSNYAKYSDEDEVSGRRISWKTNDEGKNKPAAFDINLYTTNSKAMGKFGTSEWRWDEESQTLSFYGGQFPEEKSIAEEIEKDTILNNKKIKKIRFATPVKAGESSEDLFAELYDLETIIGLEKLDTSKVTTMNCMFMDAISLKTVDMSQLNMSNVRNMDYMFRGAEGLQSVNLNNETINNVTDMFETFRYTPSLKEVDLSNWNTAKVTDMSRLFANSTVSKLILGKDFKFKNTDTIGLDESAWVNKEADVIYNSGNEFAKEYDGAASGTYTVGNTTADHIWDQTNKTLTFKKGTFANEFTMQTFAEQNNIDPQQIEIIVFSEKLKLESADSLFEDLTNLREIKQLNNLDTSKVTSMICMFMDAISLKTVDMSQLNMSNVRSMDYMFRGAEGLQSVNLNNETINNVTDMFETFRYTTSLKEVDLSNWNTAKVTDMSRLFANSTVSKLILGKDFRFKNVDTIGLSNSAWTNKEADIIYNSGNEFVKGYDGVAPGIYESVTY